MLIFNLECGLIITKPSGELQCWQKMLGDSWLRKNGGTQIVLISESSPLKKKSCPLIAFRKSLPRETKRSKWKDNGTLRKIKLKPTNHFVQNCKSMKKTFQLTLITHNLWMWTFQPASYPLRYWTRLLSVFTPTQAKSEMKIGTPLALCSSISNDLKQVLALVSTNSKKVK